MRNVYLHIIHSWKALSIFLFAGFIFVTGTEGKSQTPVAWYPFTGNAQDAVGTTTVP